MKRFSELTPAERKTLNEKLTVKEKYELAYLWEFWARGNQEIPEEIIDPTSKKYVWMILAGRGFGKTRAGAEAVRKLVRLGYSRIIIAGANASEVREIMIEGDSGILNIYPTQERPQYKPSTREILWPNGAKGMIVYGSEPDRARGLQADVVWCDELIKWQYPDDTYSNLMLGLRLGKKPICIITTTPRPIKLIKSLAASSHAIVVRGTTYENQLHLANQFVDTIIQQYENTRLGRQEIYGEILDDNPNALWNRTVIDETRTSSVNDLQRIVVAIDPQAGEDGAETGIIVAGKKIIEGVTHYYILEDCTIQAHPSRWATQAIAAYYRYKADRIIAEKNNGGEMVRATLQNIDQNIPVKLVWASRGKETRAEPVAALYEQKRVHHVGYFQKLEDQLCEWQPGMTSPDRLDAMVWGITELMGSPIPPEPKIIMTEKTKSKVKELPL